MDSINREQPEKNREDLAGTEAMAVIRELSEQAKTCFFCTAITTGQPIRSRPMSVRKLDEQGHFWFLSANDSYKNAEIGQDRRVQLFFQGSAHSDFLTIHGTAHITTDKAVIDELWEPLLRTWFTGGKDDPRITAIRVEPEGGYYWDTKHGNMVAFVKMAIGAAIGKTLDDSIEGTLRT